MFTVNSTIISWSSSKRSVQNACNSQTTKQEQPVYKVVYRAQHSMQHHRQKSRGKTSKREQAVNTARCCRRKTNKAPKDDSRGTFPKEQEPLKSIRNTLQNCRREAQRPNGTPAGAVKQGDGAKTAEVKCRQTRIKGERKPPAKGRQKSDKGARCNGRCSKMQNNAPAPNGLHKPKKGKGMWHRARPREGRIPQPL